MRLQIGSLSQALSWVGSWPWGTVSQIGVPRKHCPLGINSSVIYPSETSLSYHLPRLSPGGFPQPFQSYHFLLLRQRIRIPTQREMLKKRLAPEAAAAVSWLDNLPLPPTLEGNAHTQGAHRGHENLNSFPC